MKRTIIEPVWANEEKNQIQCIFEYENGERVLASITNVENNPDWAEIMETFGIEGVDENTKKKDEIKEQAREESNKRKEEELERRKTEELFQAKLEAFEIPEVKESKNRSLKAKIRKAESKMAVAVYAAALVMNESGNGE